MSRATHQQVIDFIAQAITDANEDAEAHEIKIIEHDIEAMNETVKVIARLDDDPAVISDALIEGLKKLNMNAGIGVTFLGTKMDWGKDNMDFCLLIFTVDMMKNCGG